MRVNPLPLYQFRAKRYWPHAKLLIYNESLFPVIGITGISKVPYGRFETPMQNRASVRSMAPPTGGDRHED